jgi:hypothetical protein
MLKYECQLKLFDQNIICNCHFPNNFLVYKYIVYSDFFLKARPDYITKHLCSKVIQLVRKTKEKMLYNAVFYNIFLVL